MLDELCDNRYADVRNLKDRVLNVAVEEPLMVIIVPAADELPAVLAVRWVVHSLVYTSLCFLCLENECGVRPASGVYHS
jgi:hypothetical protein